MTALRDALLVLLDAQIKQVPQTPSLWPWQNMPSSGPEPTGPTQFNANNAAVQAYMSTLQNIRAQVAATIL